MKIALYTTYVTVLLLLSACTSPLKQLTQLQLQDINKNGMTFNWVTGVTPYEVTVTINGQTVMNTLGGFDNISMATLKQVCNNQEYCHGEINLLVDRHLQMGTFIINTISDVIVGVGNAKPSVFIVNFTNTVVDGNRWANLNVGLLQQIPPATSAQQTVSPPLLAMPLGGAN